MGIENKNLTTWDGILLIDKEKGYTSRDVVNQISKKLNIKKVGHAGTLDPIASGLLIVGIGKATKIMDILTLDVKEYIATVKLGVLTDTLDITGNILKEDSNFKLSSSKLKKILNSFQKKYYQEVPKYSAVKINGKKLYEYARSNIDIELPKRLVDIKEIELLNYEKKNKVFKFRALVSKGTYIRSLIRDIGIKLNISCTMQDLVRIRSGKFKIEDSYKITDDFKLISIQDALDLKKIVINDNILLKKVQNGNKVNLEEEENYILFLDSNNQELAIYKKEKNKEFHAFKVF